MVVVQVRSCRAPRSTRPTRFELLEIHGRAWHPDIVSELAWFICRFSNMPRETAALAPKRPSRGCGSSSGSARLQAFFQSCHAGGRGFEPIFLRVHLAQKWAPERTPSGGFSFPPDDDEEFRGGRGKRVNRPPPPLPSANDLAQPFALPPARRQGRLEKKLERFWLNQTVRILSGK